MYHLVHTVYFFVRKDSFIGARDKSPERRIVIVCGVIQL